MHPLTRGALALAAGALVACGARGPDVARKVGDSIVVGRSIPPGAYEAYARGALLEAEGDAAQALVAFEQAARLDPASADAWGRVAALRCALGRPGAEQALAQARAEQPDLAAMWSASARCATHAGAPERARHDASLALGLAPDDLDATLAYVEASRAAGDAAGALAALDALALRREGVRLEPAWRDARAALAPAPSRLDAPRTRSLAEVVHAVASRADRDDCRDARLRRAAEPTSADAWIAALACADLERDDEGFAALVDAPSRGAAPPSASGRALLDEVLARRTDAGARR